jgi:hypothetical protein
MICTLHHVSNWSKPEWYKQGMWHVEKERNALIGIMGESQWKKPLGRPTHIWEDNYRIDFKEIGLECAEWIHVAQDRDQWNEIWILIKPGTRKKNPVHQAASNKGNSILDHYLWVMIMYTSHVSTL